MIIAFGNLKGGCGSTTLGLLLAHYLASLNKRVYLIDMSLDGGLTLLHSRSLLFHEHISFEFFTSDITKGKMLLDKLSEQADEIIILDLPKIAEQQGLSELFVRVAFFIVPLQYDMISFEASTRFSLLSAKLSPKSKTIFLPNMVFPSVSDKNLEAQHSLLRNLGGLSAPIGSHRGLMGLDRMGISPAIIFDSAAALEILYTNYLFNLLPQKIKEP